MCLGAEPHLLQTGGLQGDTVAKATALTFLCTDTPLHECWSRHLSCKGDAAAKVETVAPNHEHAPARQSDVTHIAQQGTQGSSRPVLGTKLPKHMHALSACACMCLGAEPHLLQAGALQGDTVAKAIALAFLCTTDTPLHECWRRHLPCKDDAAACRPKT